MHRSSDDSDDGFLFYKDLEDGGQYLIFTIWFDAELNRKEITESWPYMGYFFYACFMFLEGEDIPSYSDWPFSPLPTTYEIIFVALIIGTLAVGSFVIFFSQRIIVNIKITAINANRVLTTKKYVFFSYIFQKPDNTPDSLFPIAVAINQPPIIKADILAGLNFDTSDNPIGLKNSSPVVITA